MVLEVRVYFDFGAAGGYAIEIESTAGRGKPQSLHGPAVRGTYQDKLNATRERTLRTPHDSLQAPGAWPNLKLHCGYLSRLHRHGLRIEKSFLPWLV